MRIGRGVRSRAAAVLALGLSCGSVTLAAEMPNILLVTVDTLRADHLSSYGYERATSPRIDDLLAAGVRFAQARTVEPLTAPALASMLTSLHPQEHGSTRNGLRVRPDLLSLPRVLRRQGYDTAAFVGNWTLQPHLWGLDPHFERYETVLNRARWFGLVRSEATAEDLTTLASDWLDEHAATAGARPYFLWVHYVEPHAPYRLHREFLEQLGYSGSDVHSENRRYDTEIAYVDARIGELLDHAASGTPAEQTIVVFAADHGESLGEHGYRGHGRHVYDATLHIPMGLTWSGHLPPRVVSEPALLIDLAPTLIGLLGLEPPGFFQGFDWTPVLRGETAAAAGRVTYYQSHRGATTPKEDGARARQKGLLEVARLENGTKEIFRVTNSRRRVFEVFTDPAEERSLVPQVSEMSPDLARWLEEVSEGLAVSDHLPPPALSEEDLEAMRALGYID